ncbi:MAG: 2-iminoacetate synthase ThiH [Syntrophobacterales bacterium]|jgi:2-iminoacetate synthase|nr:2-iminoacetate synthase ThiH [Syntrophobacterales bacterium]
MNRRFSINPLRLTIDDLDHVFHSEDRGVLEDLAQAAQALTRQHFGRAISLYAPLYISNYCQNECAYCGFQAASTGIARKKLTYEDIDRECRALAATGIRSCLILTGESRFHSPPSYIKEAITIALRHFPNITLEVYPLETEEYRGLYYAGADGVTLYHETYDRNRYDELHLSGPKKNYGYRYQAPERIARAGFRHISMGALLGLSDWREDVPQFFRHIRYMEKRYPGVEYTLSFPRLRPVANDDCRYFEVPDRDMVKIMCAGRLLFPRAGINLSTREDACFRDRIIDFGVTKMSGGSLTTVGGYSDWQNTYEKGQFDVHDRRSVDEIKSMLINKGYDPVFTDWRNIANQNL